MAQERIPGNPENDAKTRAEIYFGDAARIRSDHHGRRSWGNKGETPVVAATGARHSMSLISAISSRGHMRFMIKQQGGVNADVFIEFLKRLIAGAKHEIFLIVDRGAAHIAKKIRTFGETLKGKLRLFYLLPYSPDRNPGELVWKHLKTDTAGRMVVISKDDFKRKVRSSIRQLQTRPRRRLATGRPERDPLIRDPAVNEDARLAAWQASLARHALCRRCGRGGPLRRLGGEPAVA